MGSESTGRRRVSDGSNGLYKKRRANRRSSQSVRQIDEQVHNWNGGSDSEGVLSFIFLSNLHVIVDNKIKLCLFLSHEVLSSFVLDMIRFDLFYLA